MRYIGGKSKILKNIEEVINSETKNVETIIDFFSGSGAVSKFFKNKGYTVISNDLLYFSYVLNRGSLDINYIPEFKSLVKTTKDPIGYLNELELSDTIFELKDCFIYQNYSPNENSERMYFQNKNAIKIDIIRKKIEEWRFDDLISEDEYFYLLSSLLNAVPFVSNITGVYGAYLKHWDSRTYKDLKLKNIEIISSEKQSKSFNCDANILAKEKACDLAYLDPPYNSRQYLPNYHVLETIAKYDNPIIKGVTGMRDYKDQKSKYCQKREVVIAFDELIKSINSKYIILSYNNEGLLDTKEMEMILKKYSKNNECKLFEFDYNRYKNKIPNNKKGLKEQLYFIEKEIE